MVRSEHLFSEVNLDSLESKITVSNDISKVKMLNRLASLYENINPEKTIYFAKLSLKVQNKLGIFESKSASFNLIGNGYRGLGNNIEALNFYQKALSASQRFNSKKETARIINNMGVLYRLFGDFPKSLELHLQALSIFQEIKDERGIAATLNKSGVVYRNLNMSVKALECYNQALRISKKTGDKNEEASALLNIGNVYWYSNMFSLALDYYQQSLAIYKKIRDLRQVAALINNIGNVYRDRGNVNGALKKFYSSLSISEDIKDNNQIAVTYKNIGRTFYIINMLDTALFYYTRSLNIALDNNLMRFVQDNYLNISEVYEKKGDMPKTIKYLRLYNQIRDGILTEEKNQNITDLQYKFNIKEKENEIRDLKYHKNQLILNVIFIVFLIVAILAGLLYSLYMNKKKYAILLEKEMAERKTAEKLLSESEEKFRTLASLLPEAIYETDEAGILAYVNNIWYELFGYTQADFERGMHAFEIIAPKDKVQAFQIRQKILSENTSLKEQFNARKKDGTVFPVIFNISPVMRQGRVVGTRGIIIDITEQQKAESEQFRFLEQTQSLNIDLMKSQEKLKKALDLTLNLNEKIAGSEANLKAMFDGSFQSYLLINRNYQILSFNKAAKETIYKLFEKEIKDFESIFDYLPASFHEVFKLNTDKAFAGEMVYEEKPFLFGELCLWYDISYIPAYDNNNNLIGVSVSAIEITERKQIEEALRASEVKFRMLVEQAVDGIFVGDTQGNFIGVNSSACKLTGYTEEELLHMNMRDLYSEDTLKKKPLRYDLLLQGEAVFNERPLIRKDGTLIPIEMNTKRMPDGTYQAFIRDVSERKIAEKALRESQRSLATVLSNIPGLVYRCKNDSDWTMEITSDGCFDLTGYKPEELIANKKLSYKNLIYSDDRENVNKKVQQGVANKKPYQLLYRILTAANQIKWVWEQGCGVFDEHGELIALEGIIIDINDRILAEEAFAKSEEKFRILVENQGEGVCILDTKERFTFVNSAAAEIFGVPVDELLSKSMQEFVDDEQLIKIVAESEISKSGKKSIYEVKIKNPQGVEKYLLNTGTPYIDKDNHLLGSFNIFTDITERKHTESKILESEQRLKFAIEAANDGLWDFNVETNCMNYLSPRFYTMLGYEPDEFKVDFQKLIELIHPGDVSSFMFHLREYIKKKSKFFNVEFRAIAKDGNYVWIFSRGKAVEYDEKGNILRIVGTHVDISDRIFAAEALKKGEEKYRLLAEQTFDIIWTMDLNMNLTYMNQSVKKHLGFSVEEYFKLSMQQKYPQEGIKITNSILKSELDKIKKGIIPGKNSMVVYELPHYHKNKSIVWGEVNFTFLFDVKDTVYGIQGTTRNITERKRVEEAMRKSEERLKFAMEAANDGLWDFNPSTNAVNYFSPRWYTLLNYEPYVFPMDYNNWVDLIHPEDRIHFQNNLKEYIDGNSEVFSVEYRMKTKDGSYRWLLSRGKQVQMDSSGIITRMVGTHSDISERKEAEDALKKSRQKYMELTEFLPQPIFEMDLNAKFVFVNRQALTTFGYTQEDFEKGINFFSLTAEKDRERMSANIQRVLMGETQQNEYTFIRKNKSAFTGIVSSIPVVANDKIVGLRGIIFDITERINIETQLKQAKDKAEESDRLKSAFLANMSHEIRTPMNAILGFTELLKSTDLTEDKKNNFIDIILKRGKDLLNIINDIIDISKIESKQLKINHTKCYLNAVLHDLHVFFGNDIQFSEKKKLKLNLKTALPDNDCFVVIDDMRLKQIFTNLLSNAIKFTTIGTIEFGYTLLNKNTLNFFVRDSGIGIPEDKLVLIFDRFRQADDSTSRHYGGTGLGLAISKSLVEMMGGTIFVESEVGKGSLFSFTLPFQPFENIVEIRLDKKNIHENYFWQDKTILIVEDDKVNFLYLSTLLRKTKVQILHALNGAEAVELFKTDVKIDLILMDIQMPVMNGYEATRIIKKINRNLPIIAQTAYAMEEDKQKCEQAGCDNFIVKPIKIDTLITVIEKYFR